MDDYRKTPPPPTPNKPWWQAHTGRARPGKLSDLAAQAALTVDSFQAELDRLLLDAARVDKDNRSTPFSAGAKHYQANLPALTSRRNVQLHLAAVVRGFQSNLIDPATVKLLLYAAQLALAAFGTHNEGPPPPPARAPKGFTE
jgi:hypothetical protein